jgi:hypothetical protein
MKRAGRLVAELCLELIFRGTEKKNESLKNLWLRDHKDKYKIILSEEGKEKKSVTKIKRIYHNRDLKSENVFMQCDLKIEME